jgi:endoglycosylceramidase
MKRTAGEAEAGQGIGRFSRVPGRASSRCVAVFILLAAVLLLSSSFAAPAGAASLSRLGHEGRWIVDQKGRVVVLHGWNMVNKLPPYAPDALGFGDDDAAFLAHNGFNYVRLGIIWKGLEPRPGVYDDAYLDRIARTARILRRHGIYVLLDFHQDMYNERYQGEGAPDWAILGRAATEGPGPQAGFPANYLASDPLNHAYDAFWDNAPVPGTGRGVQDLYAAAWRHVARLFRRTKGVVGYGLFNEPWEGTNLQQCWIRMASTTPAGCPGSRTFDRTKLTAFHKRVIRAIRGVDKRTLAWYAPVLTFDFGVRTGHGDAGDRRAGFAFNAYCAQAAGLVPFLPFLRGKPCSYSAELTFDNADAVSRRTGEALLDTEYAASDTPKDWVDYLEAADRHKVGWTHWAYWNQDPCCPRPVEGLLLDIHKPPVGTNVKRAKLLLTARPYPALVSGTPRSFRFRSRTRTFTLRYSTRRPGRRKRFRAGSITSVVVPRLQYPRGYRALVKGARVVSRPQARVLRVAACPGAKQVKLRVTRGRTPRTSRRCH